MSNLVAMILEAAADALAAPRQFKDIFQQPEHDEEVEIYLNLHTLKTETGDKIKKVWSIRSRKTGTVLGHAKSIALSDVSFWVAESTRQKIIRTRKKTVHAVVRGKIMYDPNISIPAGGVSIYYNPEKTPWFQDMQGRPVYAADMMFFSDVNETGGRPRITAINPVYEMSPELKMAREKSLKNMKKKSPKTKSKTK